MSPFAMPEFDAHERVIFGHDEASGLRAIVAIHSTALGPGAGGCRMWAYESTDDAVKDVLRLSRGMSYKNAMANLRFGGGKAVIIGNAQRDKTPALFEAFGKLIDSIGGSYVTAEDVGTTTADMEIVARRTKFVCGRPSRPGEAGGDPSPKTALGVHLGIKAAVKFRLGRSDLQGLKVAVQGVGGVGYHLCRLLAAEGAQILAADVRPAAVERVRDEFKAKPVATDAILAQDVDVVAPCALGAIFDSRSIAQLRAKVIAGAANNQLAEDRHGEELQRAQILYAPDYVINAGGIISVSHEYYGGSTDARIDADIQGIPERLTEIFERARRESLPTNIIADQMARDRLRNASRRLVA